VRFVRQSAVALCPVRRRPAACCCGLALELLVAGGHWPLANWRLAASWLLLLELDLAAHGSSASSAQRGCPDVPEPEPE
jgi:hypothetical protein